MLLALLTVTLHVATTSQHATLVLDRQDLAASPATTLGEFLAELGGTHLTGSSLFPESQLAWRGSVAGSFSGRTLVLIDGVPSHDPLFEHDHALFAALPLVAIERIEVHRTAELRHAWLGPELIVAVTTRTCGAARSTTAVGLGVAHPNALGARVVMTHPFATDGCVALAAAAHGDYGRRLAAYDEGPVGAPTDPVTPVYGDVPLGQDRVGATARVELGRLRIASHFVDQQRVVLGLRPRWPGTRLHSQRLALGGQATFAPHDAVTLVVSTSLDASHEALGLKLQSPTALRAERVAGDASFSSVHFVVAADARATPARWLAFEGGVVGTQRTARGTFAPGAGANAWSEDLVAAHEEGFTVHAEVRAMPFDALELASGTALRWTLPSQVDTLADASVRLTLGDALDATLRGGLTSRAPSLAVQGLELPGLVTTDAQVTATRLRFAEVALANQALDVDGRPWLELRALGHLTWRDEVAELVNAGATSPRELEDRILTQALERAYGLMLAVEAAPVPWAKLWASGSYDEAWDREDELGTSRLPTWTAKVGGTLRLPYGLSASVVDLASGGVSADRRVPRPPSPANPESATTHRLGVKLRWCLDEVVPALPLVLELDGTNLTDDDGFVPVRERGLVNTIPMHAPRTWMLWLAVQ